MSRTKRNFQGWALCSDGAAVASATNAVTADTSRAGVLTGTSLRSRITHFQSAGLAATRQGDVRPFRGPSGPSFAQVPRVSANAGRGNGSMGRIRTQEAEAPIGSCP
ncbi:hypothetical protein GCM10010121_001170 [Streptomyces brasiliensis]|uniref:Uncharacterized protein n=1 Tax=Streptomyces brasiliensis TaxID=1954 RepID=A0A917K2M7_9ACTN|nr:hypothetical protein GCM10010121_001170 [Streptomyces brasiliensis]